MIMKKEFNIHLNKYSSGYLEETSFQASPIQTTQICSLGELAGHLDAWRDLPAAAPMRSPEWYFSWLKHYATTDDELCMLVFHESDGSLVGLAPLYIERTNGNATIRLLGSGDACTNHTTWLAVPGWETQVGIEVAQFLIDYESDWDSLHFEWVDDDDIAINTTVACLEDSGYLLRKWPQSNCWKIALPQTWDDYLKMLSTKHRKQCRRIYRKFFESGQVEVHKVRSEKDLRKGFNILLQLHAARWGDPAKPEGVFSNQKFRSFHETVARELLKKDQLHLFWLEYEGTPIAVEYQFVGRNTVYAYQAGMDPAFGKLRPGKLSILSSIKYAIAKGCHSLDLSRGDELYKVHYRATPTPCHDIFIWPDGVSGRLGYSLGYSMKRMRYYAMIGRYLTAKWLNKGSELMKIN